MADKISLDVSFVRAANQRVVLDEIFRNQVTSRTTLASSLSMSKPAISDNLTPLIQLGLVSELGEGDAKKTGGRKPIMLSFNKNHRYIIAIDLNYSNPVFVLANLNGEVVREFDIRISKSTPNDAYLTIIEDGIHLLLTSSGITAEKLLCIAVASPGVFDAEGRLLSYNPQFSGIPWFSIDFRKALREKFDADVMIMNDINAATLGEWIHRGAAADESMLFISCGNGLGSGLILDGKLYEGRHFNAGEIFKYTDTARLQKGGTLEDAVSTSAFVARCQAFVREGGDTALAGCGDKIDWSAIVDAFGKKDGFVCTLAAEICDELSVMALNYANLLSPDSIVFGGDYIAFGDMFLDSYRRVAEKLDAPQRPVRLAGQGRYSGIHGLVCRAREQYFDRVCRAEGGAAV